MKAELAKRRFTIEEYERLAETGIFSEDDRVELIAGEVAPMTPIGRRHVVAHAALNALLTRQLANRAIIWPQGALRIEPDSELQPDLVVLRLRPDAYLDSDPNPDDILLVVEIADTSLSADRTVKLPLYARAGLREAWIVDLVNEVVEVYRAPVAGVYRDLQRVERGGLLTLSAVPGVSFPMLEAIEPRARG